MMQTIIFGASRQGTVILDALQAQGTYEFLGFLDDDVNKHGSVLHDFPVLGGTDWLLERVDVDPLKGIVAIGNNEARVTVGKALRGHGVGLINVVHPSAVMMSRVEMGSGNFINASVTIVTGTRLEDDIVINTGTTIDHDSLLCSGAQIASGVHTAGCVTVGRHAFVGVGSILGPNVTIGEGSIIGAGSLVLSDIPSHVIAFGSPAKVVKQITDPVDWRKILSGKSS